SERLWRGFGGVAEPTHAVAAWAAIR
ncbi:MAG: hypothetical protein QOD65_3673, partial [Gaiellales bacterium]|nr:hypothetical protein [Gaiellales bacterium]